MLLYFLWQNTPPLAAGMNASPGAKPSLTWRSGGRNYKSSDVAIRLSRNSAEGTPGGSTPQLAAGISIGGAIDLSIMDAHSQYVDFGRNGGVRCDVTSGPCACGAWHR